ncbi:sulfatase [Actinoallomurus sp. NPDC050550]|uniref:sulfatase family protein n=1 Tax=Actinoallomurus sp. NPDC050550 TaxID=3154937 RepID=UPI003404C7EC
MKRILALTAAACLALSACSAAAAERSSNHVAAPKKAPPNIVFVLTDDLAMNLVPYMPHVQQMQQQGTTFGNYFVTDSLCCPSRTTTFTGRFPHNTGVFTNGGNDGGYQTFNARGNQNHTFATALQAAGYRTAMMGKYLNGYQPSDPVPPGWSEWDVAGNGYPEFNYSLNENGRVVKYGHQPKDYLTNVLSNKGQQFIGQSAKAGKPFVLELATFAPHAPYTPAPQDKNKFPGLKAPRGPAFNEADMSDKPAWIKNHKKLTAKQITTIDNVFRKRAQAVQAVDRMIGNIQTALKNNGVDRDTYLVFSSDNGFHLGEHRLAQGKMTAYDTDIKVPLVVKGPGVAAGHTTNTLAQNTDLCPTFEDLAGVKVPAAVDGRSLAPFFKAGPGQKSRDGVLIEHHGPDHLAGDPDLQAAASGNPPSYEAVRTGHEVYVEYADGEREYYDLSRDPNELDNAVTRLPAARLKQLTSLLHRLEKCSGKTCH